VHSEPVVPEKIDYHYFARRAAKAREMAQLATTSQARDIHNILAADYDARAAAAAALERDEPIAPRAGLAPDTE